MIRPCLAAAALLTAALVTGCGADRPGAPVEVTFPGSAVGAEGEVLRRQLSRFMRAHPNIRIVQRPTPDAADQRHQLYVQWLNAGASDPDILQLDVVWTAEFAAAGWILSLNRFRIDTTAFFPATVAANRVGRHLYALPWFVDVGMLYWRSDLIETPPATFRDLVASARDAQRRGAVRHGFVWQGARYEGLVTTFLEYLGGHGGAIMRNGRVTVGSPAGVRALREMYRELYEDEIVPRAALTWHEEETRLAFQNGNAAFMRNWPYAYGLMNDSATSNIASRFAVAPMPAAPGGHPTAALGGAALAINKHSDHPDAAWAVIDYLTRPEQMRERARIAGQFPARVALYDEPALATALAVPLREARRIIGAAVPRPVTPVYTQLSEILQVHLHRALTRQQTPERALAEAAAAMQRLLDQSGLRAGVPYAPE